MPSLSALQRMKAKGFDISKFPDHPASRDCYDGANPKKGPSIWAMAGEMNPHEVTT